MQAQHVRPGQEQEKGAVSKSQKHFGMGGYEEDLFLCFPNQGDLASF